MEYLRPHQYRDDPEEPDEEEPDPIELDPIEPDPDYYEFPDESPDESYDESSDESSDDSPDEEPNAQPLVITPVYARVTPLFNPIGTIRSVMLDTRQWPYIYSRNNEYSGALVDTNLTSAIYAFANIAKPTPAQIGKLEGILREYAIDATPDIIMDAKGKTRLRHSLELLELIVNLSRQFILPKFQRGFTSLIYPLGDPIVYSTEHAEYIVRDYYSCELRGDILTVITHDLTPGFLAQGNFTLRLSVAPRLINVLEVNKSRNAEGLLDRYNIVPFEISALWQLLQRCNRDRNARGNINSTLVAIGAEPADIPVKKIMVSGDCILRRSGLNEFARWYGWTNAKYNGPAGYYSSKFIDVMSAEINNIGLTTVGNQQCLRLSPAGLATMENYEETSFGNYILIALEQYGDYFQPKNINVNGLYCRGNTVLQYCGEMIGAKAFVQRFGNYPKLAARAQTNTRPRHKFLPVRVPVEEITG